MKKFFKAKQLIKSMVQNDYLPGIYTKHHRVELERELMPYMHVDEF